VEPSPGPPAGTRCQGGGNLIARPFPLILGSVGGTAARTVAASARLGLSRSDSDGDNSDGDNSGGDTADSGRVAPFTCGTSAAPPSPSGRDDREGGFESWGSVGLVTS
jgi:hypothetical protein